MRRRALAALGAVALVVSIAGCTGSNARSELPNPADMVDSGSWYVREQWPHDGRPYESEHFVVYSDGAGSEARRRLAVLAEEVLAEVIDEMGVDPATMFRFPANQDKIDLYANRYNVLEGGGARAYYAGIIMWSFDHEAGPESTDVGSVRITLKHELVHVVEALLKGRFVGDVEVGDPRRMPVWFSEGTAEALSGGSTVGAPRTLDEVDRLIARYGMINPISWKVDLPLSEAVLDSYPHYYYPMAHLAVQYLLDPSGLGKSPRDLAAVMLDMGNDIPFADAFEKHIGISEADYETRFFLLMDGYLPQSELPLEAIGLAILVLLGAGVMGGSLIWSFRRRPVGAAAMSPVGDSTWTRSARRGFAAEVAVFGVVVVGVVARALFSMGFDELPPGTNLAAGYGATAGYFVVSTLILMWAVRHRSDRSRVAFSIPPLVIAATFVTVVMIGRTIT